MISLPDVAAYMDAARAALPPSGFETFFPDGPLSRTWAANRAALDAISLRARVLTGNSRCSLETTAMGRVLSMPVIVAPAGAQQRLHPEGERATGEGAARAGTIMSVSTLSTFSLAEVAETATSGRWYQLYLTRDRGLSRALVQLAEASGYEAIIVTVDNVAGLAATGPSENQAPLAAREQAFWSAGHCDPARALRIFTDLPAGIRGDASTLADMINPDCGWRDIEWLVSITSLPIIVKGIQTAEDACQCVPSGAKGLIVSNHGGASPPMEGLPGSVRALREVAEAVADTVEVYYDGGIQHGHDVLKALALGARAVLIGRAALWGLAVGGADGVTDVLRLLRRELEVAMAICGVRDARAVPYGVVKMPT